MCYSYCPSVGNMGVLKGAMMSINKTVKKLGLTTQKSGSNKNQQKKKIKFID